MIIFSPRVFFLLALIFTGGYLLISNERTPKSVARRVDSAVVARLNKSTAAAEGLFLNGSLEEDKARNDTGMQTMLDLRPKEQPKAPGDIEELTVDVLVKALEAALASAPNAMPDLPLMPSLVHDFLRNDPAGIQFGPLPSNVWGMFSREDPEHLRITLNPKLQRLRRKGVPASALVVVLIHEVDHMLTYMLGRSSTLTRNENEYRAFRSEGLYLSAFFHHTDADAVDARDIDPEKKAYYDELKRIRRALFSGQLPQMINYTYGPDPEPASAAPQQKR